MKKIVLVRHGATEWSEAKLITGTADVSLSELGRVQAQELASRLAGTPFDQVVSSDLIRAIETAKIIARPPRIDDRLRELDMGDLEGKRWDELAASVQEALIGFDGFVAPGGESVDAMKERVRSFVSDLGSGTHLLVTHGGVIRLFLREAGREDRPIAPCEVVELEV